MTTAASNVPGIDPALSPRLRALVDDLEQAGEVVSRRDAVAALGRAEITWEDVEPYAQPSPLGYARRRIARTDAFELLVMTWMPGQGSVPHDHAGSICALRIVQGHVRDSFFAAARDGLVDRSASSELLEGEVIVDASDDIHALKNDESETGMLVTLHVYAPPLPELRRFALRPAGATLAPVDTRAPRADAKTVSIVGGGFSGTLIAAQLMRLATERRRSLHLVIHDRQASFGEGPAYRTVDARHLLNVPASNMSAWPDRPNDFLDWARERDPAIEPGDFLPRKLYGEYVRSQLERAAREASDRISLEVRREEITTITPREAGYEIARAAGTSIADAVVVATGHRPPDDPLGARWSGPRTRYVQDPWASLALSAVRPDERVVLLGTGLTSVDVLLTLARLPRTAEVVAISRRGLWPAVHSTSPRPGIDAWPWLEPLLTRDGGARTSDLVRAVAARALQVQRETGDWRPAIDGMRPYAAKIWAALGERERERFLRHARAFWEVRRHRMAPKVGAIVEQVRENGTLVTLTGRVIAARATRDGVELTVRRRGESGTESLRADWIVNCTGPGAGELSIPPVLSELVAAGRLVRDAHGLGVKTDAEGRAIGASGVVPDLAVIGTLRKADLWESTAVPELRVHAATTARAVAATLGW